MYQRANSVSTVRGGTTAEEVRLIRRFGHVEQSLPERFEDRDCSGLAAPGDDHDGVV
jgi:hypothetical protein